MSAACSSPCSAPGPGVCVEGASSILHQTANTRSSSAATRPISSHFRGLRPSFSVGVFFSGGTAATGRESITQPIDVRSFRDNLAKNHAELSYMSSLGIGYTLNMHQAWVPDGFALGSLLYSLVLAPGAEQRRRVWYHREVTP